MSTSLLLKVIAGTAAGSTAIGGVAFVAINNYQKKSETSIAKEQDATKTKLVYVIAESTTENSAETAALITSKQNKNYKCKFGDSSKSIDETCVIKSIDISSTAITKKNIQLKDLNNIEGKDSIQEDLKTNKKYFKIEVANDFYEEVVQNTDANKKIEVLLSKDATSGKKYGSLVPLFAVNGDSVKGKTVYSVGKITKFLAGDNEDTTNNQATVSGADTKCIFIKDNSSGNKCEIWDFDNASTTHSSFSSLTFSKGSSKLGSITKNKYYLFKFTEDSSAAKDAELFLKDSKVKVTLNPKISVSGQDVDTLEVSDLVPVVFNGTELEFAFLLGNIS